MPRNWKLWSVAAALLLLGAYFVLGALMSMIAAIFPGAAPTTQGKGKSLMKVTISAESGERLNFVIPRCYVLQTHFRGDAITEFEAYLPDMSCLEDWVAANKDKFATKEEAELARLRARVLIRRVSGPAREHLAYYMYRKVQGIELSGPKDDRNYEEWRLVADDVLGLRQYVNYCHFFKLPGKGSEPYDKRICASSNAEVYFKHPARPGPWIHMGCSPPTYGRSLCLARNEVMGWIVDYWFSRSELPRWELVDARVRRFIEQYVERELPKPKAAVASNPESSPSASSCTPKVAPSAKAITFGKVPRYELHELRSPPDSPLPDAVQLQAGDSDLHVVEIYNSKYLNATRIVPGRGIARVRVNARDGAVTLVLLAYHAVEWRLVVERGVRLSKVIAMATEGQPTVMIEGATPEVHLIRKRPPFPDISTKADWNSDRIEILEKIAALTGKQPSTYQYQYQADSEVIVDGKRSGHIGGQGINRAAKYPSAEAFKRLLMDASAQSMEPKNEACLLSKRGFEAVVPTQACWAYSIGAHGSGRVYFEAQYTSGSKYSYPGHSQLGFALDDTSRAINMLLSDGDLFRSGDIFGVALDVDRSKAFFHVNGEWWTGAPSSELGFSLPVGRRHRAYIGASGSEAAAWSVNLGQRPFAFQPPEGFAAFDCTNGAPTGR